MSYWFNKEYTYGNSTQPYMSKLANEKFRFSKQRQLELYDSEQALITLQKLLSTMLSDVKVTYRKRLSLTEEDIDFLLAVASKRVQLKERR